MSINEFRKKIKPGMALSIEGETYPVEEVVKFRLDDGTVYFKCFLAGGYAFADDNNANCFLLVKEIPTSFLPPFAPALEFDGKKFGFLYSASAVAEEVFGKEIFKKGDCETFSDYKAADGSYLSLGVDGKTGRRSDFYGRVVPAGSLVII